MKKFEIQQLKRLLVSAVEKAYREPGLFKKVDDTLRRGNEQSIAFRVGIYLHELLKSTIYSELNLDCEYNKSKNSPKLRPEGNGSKMRPDLVIHERDTDDNNILAVEFAGWWKREEFTEIDRNKLKELTNSSYNYKYSLGVLVKFEKTYVDFEYFRKGKSVTLK